MADWRDAAEAMYIPYDDTLGVHPQSEGFTGHQVWDFAATTPEQYPLLLHFPYFDLYRKQVVKQADLVLAMHRRGDAFTAAQKARNFAYYERITVRDSSLSACTQAVIAAELGHLRLAYDYLAEAALMDLDDLEHNTRDGLHMAALAGSWIALVAGLAGMRDRDGTLSFAPRLPDGADPARVQDLPAGPARWPWTCGQRPPPTPCSTVSRCDITAPRAADHRLAQRPGRTPDSRSAGRVSGTYAATGPRTCPAGAHGNRPATCPPGDYPAATHDSGRPPRSGHTYQA